MGFYDVTLTYNYNIKAKSEEEAKETALICHQNDNYLPPSSITIKEEKKVKKTIHYTAQNYYTQDVLVDEDMNEDEIIALWTKGEIQTLNEPKIDDTRIDDIMII